MLYKTILALKRIVKIFFGHTLFGNLIQINWKKSQSQVPKKFKKKFFDSEFGTLGKFHLRIWFCNPYGTCRF